MSHQLFPAVSGRQGFFWVRLISEILMVRNKIPMVRKIFLMVSILTRTRA